MSQETSKPYSVRGDKGLRYLFVLCAIIALPVAVLSITHDSSQPLAKGLFTGPISQMEIGDRGWVYDGLWYGSMHFQLDKPGLNLWIYREVMVRSSREAAHTHLMLPSWDAMIERRSDGLHVFVTARAAQVFYEDSWLSGRDSRKELSKGGWNLPIAELHVVRSFKQLEASRKSEQYRIPRRP